MASPTDEEIDAALGAASPSDEEIDAVLSGAGPVGRLTPSREITQKRLFSRVAKGAGQAMKSTTKAMSKLPAQQAQEDIRENVEKFPGAFVQIPEKEMGIPGTVFDPVSMKEVPIQQAIGEYAKERRIDLKPRALPADPVARRAAIEELPAPKRSTAMAQEEEDWRNAVRQTASEAGREMSFQMGPIERRKISLPGEVRETLLPVQSELIEAMPGMPAQKIGLGAKALLTKRQIEAERGNLPSPREQRIEVAGQMQERGQQRIAAAIIEKMPKLMGVMNPQVRAMVGNILEDLKKDPEKKKAVVEALARQPRTVLETVGGYLEKPFLVAGGVATDIQQQFEYQLPRLVDAIVRSGGETHPMLQEVAGKARAVGLKPLRQDVLEGEEKPLMTKTAESVMGDDKKYMQDVVGKAMESVKGRGLTTGETTEANVLGLGADLAIPGKGITKLRYGVQPMRHIREAKAIESQVSGALKRAGVRLKDASEIKILAEEVVSKESLPERVSSARELLRRFTGMRPEQAAAAERELMRVIGDQGQHLGARAPRRAIERMFPAGQAKAAELQAGQLKLERGVPEVVDAKKALDFKQEIQGYKKNLDFLTRNTPDRVDEISQLKGVIQNMEKRFGKLVEQAPPPGVDPVVWSKAKPAMMPMGAVLPKSKKGLRGDIKGAVAYGGGLDEGVINIQRRAESTREAGMAEASKGFHGIDAVLKEAVPLGERAKTAGRELAFEQPREASQWYGRGRELGQWMDFRGVRGKYERKAKLLEDTLGKLRSANADEKVIRNAERNLAKEQTAYQNTLERLGFKDVAELEAKLGPKTPREHELIKALEDSFQEMSETELKAGIEYKPLAKEEYFPRIETSVSKETHLTASPTGVPPAGAKPKFGKYRLGAVGKEGEERFITVGDTEGNREFIQNVGRAWAERKIGSAISLSKRQMEKDILAKYGRKLKSESEEYITDSTGSPDLPKATRADANAQGLSLYQARTGPERGQMFLIDEKVKATLDKFMSPKKDADYVKKLKGIMQWWKAQATVLRPGFAVRNILAGNLWQLHLADAAISSAMPKAAVAQAIAYGRSPVLRKAGPLAQGHLARAVEAMPGAEKVAKGDMMVGKYTMDQVVDLGRQYKIDTSDFFAGELKGQGEAARTAGELLNPFGSRNALQQAVRAVNTLGEQNARWALFIDRLEKGMPPWMAADDVSKYLFFYDERSPILKGLGTVLPFATFSYKNWGLQLADALGKPDRLSKYLHTKERIQYLEPKSEEDVMFQMLQPDYMRRQGAFFLPGQGSEFVMTGNLMPVESMNQLWEPGNNLRILRELGDMLHPYVRYPAMMAVSQMRGAEAENEGPSFWGTPAIGRKVFEADWAPTFIGDFMDWCAEKNIPEWEMRALVKVFQPAYRDGKIVGYKWPVEMRDVLNGIPALALVGRAFRDSPDKDAAYDTFMATLFGTKVSELDYQKIGRSQQAVQERQKESMKSIRGAAWERGTTIEQLMMNELQAPGVEPGAEMGHAPPSGADEAQTRKLTDEELDRALMGD
jgi:hypothetical protein